LPGKKLCKVVEAKGKEKLRDWLDDTYHEISVYLEFPSDHWTRIKSTNPLERLNEELRRREKSIPHLPRRKELPAPSGSYPARVF